MKTVSTPPDVLGHLYWCAEMTPNEIAGLFGIKHERSLRKRMERYGIPRRTASQAMTKKFKMPFTGADEERAFLLGLRAGDFNVRKNHFCYRIQTSTTHPAQVELLRRSFHQYAEICRYYYKYQNRQPEWFIYADLHPSFGFLENKPQRIPQWIMSDDHCFFQFLAAYVDCEGNWHVSKSHERWTRVTLRIRSCDVTILRQMHSKLAQLGMKSIFALDCPAGTIAPAGPMNKDFYSLIINRKADVLRVAEKVLPLSKHPEKIRKAQYILKHHLQKYQEFIVGWNVIREEIRRERLKK